MRASPKGWPCKFPLGRNDTTNSWASSCEWYMLSLRPILVPEWAHQAERSSLLGQKNTARVGLFQTKKTSTGLQINFASCDSLLSGQFGPKRIGSRDGEGSRV